MKDNVEVRNSKKHGKGLFVLKDFKNGEEFIPLKKGKP
jgi:hypothetical protein